MMSNEVERRLSLCASGTFCANFVHANGFVRSRKSGRTTQRGRSMDFHFTPEDDKFRAQCRVWLDQNRPEREDDDLDFFAEDESEWNRRVKWFKKLASGGWTCVDWPKEYGGRGFGILQTIVYHQELGRVHAPLPLIRSGVGLFRPPPLHR